MNHTSPQSASTEPFEAIQGLLVEVTIDLFAAYGVTVNHARVGNSPEVTLKNSVVSTIGYAGSGMRGALILMAQLKLMASLQPEGCSGLPSDDVVRDLAGEFSNMALGRLKNRLLRHKVTLLPTTPTAAFGVELRLASPATGQTAWHLFESERGRFFVRFDATFAPDFQLAPECVESSAAAEGEMLIL